MFKITHPTPADWDAFVHAQPCAHVLQFSAWGDLKAAFGWQAQRIALTDDKGAVVAGAQILFRPLPFRLGTMAYVAMSPYVTASDQWTALWKAVHRVSREHGAAFLKWEPGLCLTNLQPEKWSFRPSPQTVQPPRTIVIDISGTDDAIMARMNQGTRRKIRQSLKNDIRYYEGARADVDTFTRMMQTTGSRNEFGVHEPRYYEMAYDLFVPDHAALILAEHEGTPLAGIMVFAAGKTAWYLYGASSSEKRNLMATYGIQWKAIEWAKARGCTEYDLWGIPDAEPAELEAQFEQRDDGLWGVYGFKRGWGGEVVRSVGAFDYVYNPLIYNGYRFALWAQETYTRS